MARTLHTDPPTHPRVRFVLTLCATDGQRIERHTETIPAGKPYGAWAKVAQHFDRVFGVGRWRSLSGDVLRADDPRVAELKPADRDPRLALVGKAGW